MKTTWTRDDLFSALLAHDQHHGLYRQAGSFEGRTAFAALVGGLTPEERAAWSVVENGFWSALPRGSYFGRAEAMSQ